MKVGSWQASFLSSLSLASLLRSLFHIRGLSANMFLGNKRGEQVPCNILGEIIFFVSRTWSGFFFPVGSALGNQRCRGEGLAGVRNAEVGYSPAVISFQQTLPPLLPFQRMSSFCCLGSLQVMLTSQWQLQEKPWQQLSPILCLGKYYSLC